MEISHAAPAKAQHSRVIEAKPEEIWRILTDVNRWPTWNPLVSSAKLSAAFGPGVSFPWKSGGITIVSTPVEVVPPRRIVWTGRAIGTRAIHVWELEPLSARSTQVTTAESFDGWLVRLMKGAMQQKLDSALQSWLEHLKIEAEKAPPPRG